MKEDVKQWITKAMEDYRIAEHELSFPEDEIATGPVCFHCQQVIEKLLKAFLITQKLDFSKTHDLEYLVKLCSEIDTSFRALEIGTLTSYAVDVRYPDDFYSPSIDETRHCFEIATRAKDFILKKI
jgi:HEPN domain-containing protein